MDVLNDDSGHDEEGTGEEIGMQEMGTSNGGYPQDANPYAETKYFTSQVSCTKTMFKAVVRCAWINPICRS